MLVFPLSCDIICPGKPDDASNSTCAESLMQRGAEHEAIDGSTTVDPSDIYWRFLTITLLLSIPNPWMGTLGGLPGDVRGSPRGRFSTS